MENSLKPPVGTSEFEGGLEMISSESENSLAPAAGSEFEASLKPPVGSESLEEAGMA